MATSLAPQTHSELVGLLANDNKVKVAGIDADGVLRGKYMSKEKFLSCAKGDGFGFCSVIFGWDIHDATYTKELLISNRQNGYRDILAVIDLSTFRRLPHENNSPFFLVSFFDPVTKVPICACPRGLLKTQENKMEKMGWEGLAGVEFEYYQFKESASSIAEKGFMNLTPLTPGMHGYSLLRPSLNNEYFHSLFDLSEKFDIGIEAHHTETGPGVFETALAYTKASRVADNAILYKLLAKTTGMKYEIMPTFMAKPYSDLPGCSGHIHVSLKSSDGSNAFALKPEEIAAGGRPDASFKDTKYISKTAEHFLAGLLDGLKDILPLLCPTINSYKRLAGGEAFWAPNLVSWGFDSRAASIRVLGPPDMSPKGTRFEIRVPGADVNAHYALAAIFALGLRGIEKKLEIPFGPAGQVDKSTLPLLATDLKSSVADFKHPQSVARECFGNEFVDHFAGTREHEIRVFESAVTNWELARGFELS